MPPPPRKRVLCVDDEPAIRTVLSTLLTRENFVVETADDGLDGWRKILANDGKYDVVVTDGQMPNVDGVEFVRRLRTTNYPGRIVVFSSRPTPETIEKLHRLGVDAIIEKGSTVTELLAAIHGSGL
ncbi:MAG TPA: response regulator [Opitutaceae bacterium]|nr:response regulator [Opitutaceae bacterium]